MLGGSLQLQAAVHRCAVRMVMRNGLQIFCVPKMTLGTNVVNTETWTGSRSTDMSDTDYNSLSENMRGSRWTLDDAGTPCNQTQQNPGMIALTNSPPGQQIVVAQSATQCGASSGSNQQVALSEETQKSLIDEVRKANIIEKSMPAARKSVESVMSGEVTVGTEAQRVCDQYLKLAGVASTTLAEAAYASNTNRKHECQMLNDDEAKHLIEGLKIKMVNLVDVMKVVEALVPKPTYTQD